MLPAANTNKNNNNFSTQANRDQLAVKRRLFASQTLVFKSDQTEEHEEESRTGSTCGSTNKLFTVPPASAEAVRVSVNNDAGGGTNTVAHLPSQANATLSKSRAANPEAAEARGVAAGSLKDNETE